MFANLILSFGSRQTSFFCFVAALLCRISQKSLCTCVRRVVYCARNENVPYKIHLKKRLWCLSCHNVTSNTYCMYKYCTFIHCDLHCNLHPTGDRRTGTFHILCTLHVQSKVLTVVTVAYNGTEYSRNVPMS